MGTSDARHIEPASIIYNLPDQDYIMSATVRGFCLIINNVEFEGIFEPRKGSDKDAYEFKDVFKRLGFQVVEKRNATSDKMRALFKSISLRCTIKHEALVVILLSHGTETAIYGTDCIEVEINDILNHFDNKVCSQMKGKPKIFIVQACRGRKADFGINSYQFISQPDSQSTLTQQSQISQISHKMPRWSESDRKGMPTRTDMLLCFSCHTGYNSIRDENEGSWLGDSLAHYLRTESYHNHLIDILNYVSRDMKNRKSTNGYKQVLEITTIGFDKHLYFNPGYFPDKEKEMAIQNRRDSWNKPRNSRSVGSTKSAVSNCQESVNKTVQAQMMTKTGSSPDIQQVDDNQPMIPLKIPKIETRSSGSTSNQNNDDVKQESSIRTRSNVSVAFKA